MLAKQAGRVVEKRRPRSRGDDPLVRAVGSAPVKVHTKLLVAFVGTAVLLVAVGVLGQRVLGQSNDRVRTLGALQQRAVAYGELQSDTSHVRLLLAENVDLGLLRVLADAVSDAGVVGVAWDQAIDERAQADRAGDVRVDNLGFTPPAEDERGSSTGSRRRPTELRRSMQR